MSSGKPPPSSHPPERFNEAVATITCHCGTRLKDRDLTILIFCPNCGLTWQVHRQVRAAGRDPLVDEPGLPDQGTPSG